jgi:hypothetical protein
LGVIMALHDLNRKEQFDARFAHYRTDTRNAESIAHIYAWIGDNDRAFEWLDKMIKAYGPEMLRSIDTDLYAKIKPDPRWRALRDEYGYDDAPVEAIEFTYTLPPGASID